MYTQSPLVCDYLVNLNYNWGTYPFNYSHRYSLAIGKCSSLVFHHYYNHGLIKCLNCYYKGREWTVKVGGGAQMLVTIGAIADSNMQCMHPQKFLEF